MKKIFVLMTAVLLSINAYAVEFADIDIKDLQAAIDSKSVVILDANGTESFNKGHIPGAINFEVSKGDLATVLPADKNTLIVAYCGGPKCKAYKKAAKAALKLGYTNVKHLSAGISGWTEAGQKVDQGS